MRSAVAALAVISSVIMLIHAFVFVATSPDNPKVWEAGDKALYGAAALFLGGVLVIPVPRVSTVLFLVVGVLGFTTGESSDYKGLYFWGVWGILLAALSYYGFHLKRSGEASDKAKDAQIRQSVYVQQQMAAQIEFLQRQAEYQQQLAEYQKQYPDYRPPPPQ